MPHASFAPRLSRKRKWFFALGAAVVTLTLGLVAAEVITRVLYPISGHYERTDDPILFYRLTANIDCLEAGYRRTHTAQHIRGPFTYEHDPPPGATRIAWIGDSACFGSGVGDDATAPYRFYEMAQQRGLALESINLGVVGYNVRQALEVIRKRCVEFHGLRTIVYYHHLNDIVNAPWSGVAPFIPWRLYWDYERPGNPVVRLLKRSAFGYRLAHNRTVVSLLKLGQESDGLAIQPAHTDSSDRYSGFDGQCASLYDERNSYGARFRDDLFAMADESRRQGVAFCMVYFPVKGFLGRPISDKVSAALARWCGQRLITFVDVSTEFRDRQSPELYADPAHPGPLGQRIIADAVWKALQLEPPSR